jgi:hypothetical protein
MSRERLPARRASSTFELELAGLHYTVSVGRLESGELAEIFVTNGKCGSDSDTAARDSAVVASIALQYGVPLETIRHALMRNRDGSACGPLGVALDAIAAEDAR